MNDKPRFENEIISKKQHKIDEEEPQRKGKKYKKHKQEKQDPQSHSSNINTSNCRPSMKSPTNHDKLNHQEKILVQLCRKYPSYKQGTVLKVLEKHDFNQRQTSNQLLMIIPDNQKQEQLFKEFEDLRKIKKKQSGDKTTSSTPSENANNIMNDVFDTLLKEQINGREFEELFEEIAQLVRVDQEERGVPKIEINQLLDECSTVKQTLFIGFRQQFSNFDDFELDSTSPLYAQIQDFVEDIIKRQVEQQKQLQRDFPSLQFQPAPKSSKKNIVEKIKQENKIKKQEQEFFTSQRQTLPSFARQKHNGKSIFNVDNKLTSQQDLMNLHRNYQDVPIIDLKFTYKALCGDYNRIVEFLNKHYQSKNPSRTVQEIRIVSKQKPRQHKKIIEVNHMREQEIDEEVSHFTLEQMRDEIDHLYRLKQAFQLTKIKVKDTKQRKELDRISNQNEPFLRKLCKASRILTIQQMVKKDPLYVDLHGYRQEEVSDLCDAIHRMLNEQYNKGNDKIRLKTVRGQKAACLIMMTGKGIHSRGNRSVLKPEITHWCQENDIFCEEQEDHMKVYMTIN